MPAKGVEFRRECDVCGVTYTARSGRAKYCSGTCSDRAHQARKGQTVRRGTLHKTTVAFLESVERDATVEGVHALNLAKRLDSCADSAAAALSKRFEEAFAAATKGLAVEASPLDELAALRRRRGA